MAAGKGGVELALILFGICIRLKPSVNLQSNINYVKPENLGFYASSTILKESKYDFTIEKLYPSALVNSITTQNGRPLKTKTIFVQRKNKNSTNYCFILYILLSGDVHYNPGPIKYPCTYCKKPTKCNQKALQCDFCDDWTHLKCTSLSLSEYKTLSRSDDCYFCHLCEDRLPKFTESYFQVSCMRDCNTEFDETSVDKSNTPESDKL